MKKIFRYCIKAFLIIIFTAAFFLAAGFFAVRWGITNVAGEEDDNSFAYNLVAIEKPILDVLIPGLPLNLSVYGEREQLNWCLLGAAAEASPYDAASIFEAYKKSKSEQLLNRMLLALELRKGQKSDFSQSIEKCENKESAWNEKTLTSYLNNNSGVSVYTWQGSEYWQIIKEAILKDKEKINETAMKAGIQPRMLVSVAIVEQLRLYYTQREFYEKLKNLIIA